MNFIKLIIDYFISTILRSIFFLFKITGSKIAIIITSKFFISILDNEGYLIDRYPIIDQPIYKLLSKDVDFRKLFKFIKVNNFDNEIIIEVTSKNEVSIKLIFNKANYSLKNWEIIDELGQSTYLEFTKIRKNISIDPKLFIVK